MDDQEKNFEMNHQDPSMEIGTAFQEMMALDIELDAAQNLTEIVQKVTKLPFSLGAAEAQLFVFILGEDNLPSYTELAVNIHKADTTPAIPVGTRLNMAEFPIMRSFSTGSIGPLLISDAPTDERIDSGVKALFRQNGVTSSAILSLSYRKKPVGILLINWESPYSFPEDSLQLYKVLTRLTSVAVNNQITTAHSDRVALEMKKVSEISTRVSTISDAAEILETVVNLAKDSFGLYHAHIYLLDPEGEQLVLSAGAGDVGKTMLAQGWQIPINREQSLVARAARSRQGVIINDVHNEPGYLPNELLPKTRAEMAIPLLAGNELLGVLDVQSEIAAWFTSEDIEILTTLGSHVAVALQNSDRYTQVEAMLAETDSLYKASVQINAAQTFDELLLILRENTLTKQGSHILSLSIFDRPWTEQETPDWINVIARFNVTGEYVSLPRYPIKNFPAAQTLLHPDRSTVIEDIEAAGLDPNTYQLYVNTFHAKSALFAPLVAAGQWIGYVNAIYPEPTTFTAQDIQRLSLLTHVVAAAVQNLSSKAQIEANLKITQEAKIAIEQKDAQLSEAMDIARLANWDYDVENDRFHFNDQFFKIFHTSAEEQGGYELSSMQYATQLVHPEDVPVVGAAIEKALASTDKHYSTQLEHRILYKDGGVGYISVSVNIERDDQGKIVRYYGANQDITERRLAEEALRQNEERLSEALDIASLANWEYDVENDRFHFNDQFFKIFHTTAEEQGGYELSSMQYATQLVHPEDVPVVGAAIEKALASTDKHYSTQLEHRILYKDGGVGYISVSVNIERDDQGKIVRYYGANQDITERRLAEQIIARRAVELATVAEVSTLISTILDSDEMLQNVVDLTKDRFQLYHAHIYLLNPESDTLVLTSGAGEIGKQMVAEKRTIPMNAEKSLVARTARELKGTIVNDVHQDPDFLPHRLLPETRAELAVPLIVGDRLLGVLDVQDNTVSRFTEENSNILTTLGAQVAVALQNIRQYEETQHTSALLSEAMDIARLANWDYDVENDRFHFNDQFFKIFHTSAEEQGGYELSSMQYATQLVHPEDVPVVGAAIEKALASTDKHYSTQLEHRILYKDGGVGYISVSVNIERDDQGKIVRYYGANQDITERRLAEEALRQNEERLSEALEIASLANWEYDVENDRFHFNDQFFKIFHTSAEEQGGYELSSMQYATQLVHPEDVPVVGAAIEKALASTDKHYSTQLEHRILYKDGGVGYISVNIHIERNDQGKIVRYYGANQDITDRVLAELALRQNEERLSEALEIASLANWEYDVENDRFHFNDQFFKIFHTTAEEQGGYELSSMQYATQLVHPDDVPVVGAAIEKGLASTDKHYSTQLEHRILYKDGGVGYISVNVHIERDDQGKIIRYYGANQDITERRLAEQIIARRAVELATVAEVSTSISTILDAGELLQNVVDLTKDRFQLYHAHIYLLNPESDTLVLTSGAGEIGKQMVAQGWRIPIGREQSLVAKAARTHLGVIVNDVQSESGFLPNPLLPDTRSEMAVPMIVGNRLIGVLDIQSDQINYFTEEDIKIQNTLAVQVAVALQNARSFEQIQHQADQEALINEISQKIQTTTSVETALQVAVRELGRALGAHRTTVQLNLERTRSNGGQNNG